MAQTSLSCRMHQHALSARSTARSSQVSTYVAVRCQAFLEAPNIASRLKLGLTALRKHRKVLVALTSLKGLEDA